MAAALWQYVLPPCGSAQLHDPADDERMVKSQGKLAGVCARTTDVMHSSRVFISCWLCFGLTFAPTSPTMRFLLAISCWLVSLFLLCYSFFLFPSQQCGGDPQSWSKVFAVLKGTSLFCYHRQEDVETNIEPVFTIGINKVS